MGSYLPRRVLLVNDSRDEREMYAEWFRRQGCCTLQAENAAEGYKMASELAPDVVITDVKLTGGEDGLTLTRRLKHDVHTREVPVVVLSGYVFTHDDDAAHRAGCDLVMHKPCLPDALAEAIAKLLPSLEARHRRPA
jgi:two-component system cell cycle response regulator DivK